MALTELAIKRLGKKSKRYEIHDGGGLYIRVALSGLKTWIFRYQFDGRPRRMGLGKWPGIGVAVAHEKHGLALQQLHKGIDPGALALEKKAKLKTAPTVKELLDEFYLVELSNKPSGDERKRLLKKDILPAWGKRKVADITRRDAVLLIDKVRKRAPIGASRLQSAMIRMWNFAAERGIIDFSPMVGMKRPKENPRTRVLSDDEIKKLWAGLDLENMDIDIFRPTKLAIKMIILTGQRPGEISDMRWSEIDGDVWTVPAERAKNRQENRVPLGRMALEVLKDAKSFSSPDCDYVFESSYKPGNALSRAALGKAIHRHWKEMKLDQRFTPHDLRRTLRTGLAEIGVTDVIAERVLGHKLQGLLAVYNQHSYDNEKRQAIIRWETKISAIIGHDNGQANNVIQFSTRSE
ncbi:tyrosine-type recombinase/integrase [uncultured Desulfosarcina sp.]|uniref:tyrosine-type recombinase/integrase n=1 Tax=uncultured Desulfosarcina sp. TaxID=218289 RepID=UPI0029C6E35E|nr:tyrosine-type recombinase/integrase [uncultured Desulfosarcina sp.]